MFVVRTYVRMFVFVIFCGKILGKNRETIKQKQLVSKMGIPFWEKMCLEMLFLKECQKISFGETETYFGFTTSCTETKEIIVEADANMECAGIPSAS